MPREYPRSRRVGDQIQRELAQLIRDEVKDPRVALITVTEVEVSRDLAHAKVFFGSLSEASTHGEMTKVLNGAAGFLRRELAKRLSTRTVPELRFHYDTALEEGARMDALISKARADDEARGTGGDE
ncbi:MAG: 30S ribosome-binding factor RbfA [Xanthomonadaceae bacterium]|nr:30S ribosome-binding factor RbfA [Xanthomonadaceae bacterium]